uniref:Mvd1 C-terminal domain-containing protein n=1 Tax=Malurus cyaneus samueli TaxID=2593467 RepID=A0A8C5T3E4_9PASS
MRGERPDGTDSLALQVAPETHWPELRVLVLVVSGEKKPVGSTAGMQTSVETSPLLKVWGHGQGQGPFALGMTLEGLWPAGHEGHGGSVPMSPQCHHRSPTPSTPAPTPSSSRWPTPWPSSWRW